MRDSVLAQAIVAVRTGTSTAGQRHVVAVGLRQAVDLVCRDPFARQVLGGTTEDVARELVNHCYLDLAQDAARIWDAPPPPPDHPLAWLRTCARRALVDLWRSWPRRARLEDAQDPTTETGRLEAPDILDDDAARICASDAGPQWVQQARQLLAGRVGDRFGDGARLASEGHEFRLSPDRLRDILRLAERAFDDMASRLRELVAAGIADAGVVEQEHGLAVWAYGTVKGTVGEDKHARAWLHCLWEHPDPPGDGHSPERTLYYQHLKRFRVRWWDCVELLESSAMAMEVPNHDSLGVRP